MTFGQIFAAWWPFALLLAVLGYLIWKASKQYRDYYEHLNNVNKLAEESRQLNAELLEHSRQSLKVLEEIRDTLKAGR